MAPSSSNLISPEGIPGLEEVLILAGESITVSQVREWAARVSLINTYGPAECCIVSTVAEPSMKNSEQSNIGQSYCGKTWLVDPKNYNELSPVNALSELVLGGPELA